MPIMDYHIDDILSGPCDSEHDSRKVRNRLYTSISKKTAQGPFVGPVSIGVCPHREGPRVRGYATADVPLQSRPDLSTVQPLAQRVLVVPHSEDESPRTPVLWTQGDPVEVVPILFSQIDLQIALERIRLEFVHHLP